MDFSSANTALWGPIIQIGILAGLLLIANILRRKIKLIRNSLMPTAVLAGFILLLLRSLNILPMDAEFLETITYHGIALGFIALALRVPDRQSGSGALAASKNGALIVSTYLIQAVTGLVIAILLALTIMPELFKASGILLAMAYGQGPGQANNVGTTYESLGMIGGQSFGLSLAAAGYLCACVVGVIYLNVLSRKGKIQRADDKIHVAGSITTEVFQNENEIPVAESIDKFSVQGALVALVYLLTYLFTWGVVSLLEAVAPGVAATVSTLLWGFNFIVGSILATLLRTIINRLRKHKIMTRQYQNNYLLSRFSGVAFDLMIVAGIASINISDLKGLWLPFLLMAVAGGVVTFYYLRFMCKKMYPGYEYEGFLSMYGMLTGTISSGVLLLREIDPNMQTPASNNLITGSSFGIVFGAPLLVAISFAAQGETQLYMTLALLVVYFAALLLFIFKTPKNKSKDA